MEEACSSHSMAPMSCRLIAAVIFPEDSGVSAGGGCRTGMESGV